MEILAATLRLATPLLFASMGGLFCERAGISTICIEGALITSAFFSAITTYLFGDPYIGLSLGLIVGSLTMSLHAILTLKGRTDHIISGLIINFLAAGLTPLLCFSLFESSTSSPALVHSQRFLEFGIPLLSSIPFIGKSLFHHNIFVYIALTLPFICHFIFYRTVFGSRLRASGDAPEALTAAGVSLFKTRLLSLVIGGGLIGIGGVYLSMAHGSQFIRDMSAGRGFIALAALIFGKWKPLPTFLACLLFGFLESLQIFFEAYSTTQIIPIQLLQGLPYLTTLLVLVFFMGESKPPLAIGKEV